MQKIEIVNLDLIYEVAHLSQITAVFETENQPAKFYVCTKEERGYIFKHIDNDQGLNSWWPDCASLVWDALKPLHSSGIKITVFVDLDA